MKVDTDNIDIERLKEIMRKQEELMGISYYNEESKKKRLLRAFLFALSMMGSIITFIFTTCLIIYCFGYGLITCIYLILVTIAGTTLLMYKVS